MSDKKLHELVNKVDKNKYKKQIGYVVNSYNNVFKNLYKGDFVYVKEEGDTNVINMAASDYLYYYDTRLMNISLEDEGILDKSTGFYQKTFQANVKFNDYMSFVVDDDDTKSFCARNGSSASVSQHLSNGYAYKGKFLPDKLPHTGLDGSVEEYTVGIGIGFQTLGVQYFSHFFELSEGKWDNFVQEKAEEGKLFAEIYFDDISTALYAKVTVGVENASVGTNPQGNNEGAKMYNIWLPTPLLLLDKHETLASVYVDKNSKSEKVNGSSVKFPFSNSSYDFKRASIRGFGPSAVKEYIDKSIFLKSTQIKSKTGRIRLFFDSSYKDEILSEIKLKDNNYVNELFKGNFDEKYFYQQKKILISSEYNGGLSVIFDVGHYGGSSPVEYKINDRFAKIFHKVAKSLGVNSHISRVKGPTASGKFAKKKALEEGWGCIVSIHQNAPASENETSPCGTVVLYKRALEGPDKDKGGHPLSESLANKVYSSLERDNPFLSNRAEKQKVVNQVKRDSFLLAVANAVPAILLECGFYTNPQNRSVMEDNDEIEKFAYGLIRGIINWYNIEVKSNRNTLENNEQ